MVRSLYDKFENFYLVFLHYTPHVFKKKKKKNPNEKLMSFIVNLTTVCDVIGYGKTIDVGKQFKFPYYSNKKS